MPSRATSAMLTARQLTWAYDSALQRLEASHFAWSACTGPLSNALMWAHFAGWIIVSPVAFVDHNAQSVNLLVGSPAVARDLLLEGVRLQLAAQAAAKLQSREGIPLSFDCTKLWFHPLQAVLRSSNWTAKEKYWVRAFTTGGGL